MPQRFPLPIVILSEAKDLLSFASRENSLLVASAEGPLRQDDKQLCSASQTRAVHPAILLINMRREHRYYVYILSSKSRRIYTGVTNNLFRRVLQHKRGEIEGFTQHYRINRLVYYETFQYVGNAIRREKVIKGWLREKKIALIEQDNPTWDDLAEDWGKPLPRLSVSTAREKAGPSLRSG